MNRTFQIDPNIIYLNGLDNSGLILRGNQIIHKESSRVLATFPTDINGMLTQIQNTLRTPVEFSSVGFFKEGYLSFLLYCPGMEEIKFYTDGTIITGRDSYVPVWDLTEKQTTEELMYRTVPQYS